MGPHGACGKMAQVCCVPELVSGTRDLFKAPVKDGGDGKRIQRKGGGGRSQCISGQRLLLLLVPSD